MKREKRKLLYTEHKKCCYTYINIGVSFYKTLLELFRPEKHIIFHPRDTFNDVITTVHVGFVIRKRRQEKYQKKIV